MKSFLKNIIITFVCLAVAFGISYLFAKWFDSDGVITAVFMLGVLVVSAWTNEYLYGILMSVLSVLCINYAFREPYFKFNFTLAENVVNAVAILIISVVTSTLTKQIKRFEKLRHESEAEKMRANLLRAVSHDLRTPLTSIFGAGTTVYDNYDILPDEDKKMMIKGIAEDSEWLIHMVENLLSVTKADGNNINIVKSTVVLEELFDAVLMKFKKRFPEVLPMLDIPDEIVMFSADPILIEQVILNIMENSVKHAEGMTELKLKASLSEEKIKFEISDNGCGMDKSRMKNIFAGILPESSSSDSKRNLGIGLSACNAIIKAHGSVLKVSALKPKGVKFYFTLMREEI